MKVVILCGGKGTRIRGVDDDLPKPMIPVGEYPIVRHIMNAYARFGYMDFVLCLGYKGNVIKDHFLNNRSRIEDWNITLAETGMETQTGSRVKKIAEHIGDDDLFMLTYGDGVSSIDIAALVDFHKGHGKLMTVSGVRPPSRFGELAHDENGLVTEFNEKPQATGGRISGGFFVCNRAVLDYLDAERDDEILENEPMHRIAAEGQMMMYAHDGFWQCMDTFREFTLLNNLFDSGEAPWVEG